MRPGRSGPTCARVRRLSAADSRRSPRSPARRRCTSWQGRSDRRCAQARREAW
ncbi:hypothetical protein R2601_04313 [Salipiger bermudensis HTCC2601]|uniref:Uncharacterized protein n=1 Tax=Salipiger bermudensis (strain DSM 26914 / JCM 13377 / KCTC 12554 / HTCC2601) TaxID=314265 RepID=Q0FVY3_SALBH|nr:hypothetical protein R2601_04313 [Salipiger bermudensis HTCC2601]